MTDHSAGPWQAEVDAWDRTLDAQMRTLSVRFHALLIVIARSLPTWLQRVIGIDVGWRA